VAKALKASRSSDPAARSEAARLAARRAATRWSGKKPQVIVTLFED
jgi:ribonuclease J